MNKLTNIPVVVKIFFDSESRQTWAVRVVLKGERYGLCNCLIYDKEEPLVEFYDTRSPLSNLGQFVSRYNLSTMLEHPYGQGLCLDGGIPVWTIENKAFACIQDWLSSLQFNKGEA